ncbi:MAG: cupin domain-containing protein [Woeseiaceae bacterium]
MNANIEMSREAFVKDLLDNNFTTYLVATHAKYSTSNPAFRFTPAPVSAAVPYSWSYQAARDRLMRLGSLLTPEEAERRNINFVNPSLKDFMPGAALPTLRGGIQLLLPGEKAYAHRHTANAFRLVFEAPKRGAYTNVEGYRLPMGRGDLILTPNWTWHDHHNEGDGHVIWYDGLDVLMACWIGAVFFEEMRDVTGEQYQNVRHEATAVTDSHGPGLAHRRRVFPEHIPASDNTLIYYPYDTVRRSLRDLAAAEESGPQIVVDYVNPATSGPSFPTMGTSMRLVRPGSTVPAVRRTENVIFVTMEGSVTFRLADGTAFSTKPFDVTAMPSWTPYSIANSGKEPAILFSQTDRPLFEKLGFYREHEA